MTDSELYSNIKAKSITGIKWQGLAELVIRIVQFITTIILARILVPEDFGLINIALIFTQLVYVIFDFGFSSALIQKKEVTDQHYKSVFSILIASAIIFFGLIHICSGLIAAWFNNQDISAILDTVSYIIFAYALHAIPQIILMREIGFKNLSRAQLLSAIFYCFTAILLAVNGFGVYSFVYAVLGEQFFLAILLIVITGWVPKFGWNIKAIKEIIKFGSSVLGTRIAGYISINIPNIIIGKVLGAHWLGIYSIAYQLIDFPVQRIAKMVLKVMFPAFSKLQDQLAEFKDLYKKLLYYLELILFPVFTGMIIIAEPFFHVIYGDKWNEAILPFQILIGFGILRSLWVTNSLVFLSIGKPHIEMLLDILFIIISTPVLYFASLHGLVWLCVALLIIFIGTWMIGMIISNRLIEMPLFSYLKTGFIPITGCLFMLGFSILTIVFWENMTVMTELFILLILNIFVYSLIIYLLDKEVFINMKSLVRA